jgi:glycosyltransferase involved in cell wall biosynthesis
VWLTNYSTHRHAKNSNEAIRHCLHMTLEETPATKLPPVSVVMPVHNGRPFIDESIQSILDQTFSDFEFVILDDGSTDGSGARLCEWALKDSRIRLCSSPEKFGLSGSSNVVVQKSRAPLIARMDADDVSHPDRLKRQLEVLQRRPEVAAVGTLCDGIDAVGRVIRPRDRWRIVRRSPYIPFPHGSVMFRREAFEAVGGYRKEFSGGEDQDLFFRMTAKGSVVTLPDTLYHYRYHSDNSTILSNSKNLKENGSQNGNHLAEYYMLGAMRLWSGQPPNIFPALLAKKAFTWDTKTLVTFASASWGSLNPASLRFFLRSLIHARDLLASVRVKDGRPYEWRSE